jgi:predicted ATP-dependent serine protease
MNELKTGLQIYEEEKKRQEEQLKKVKEKIEGKTAMLFGEPMIGKSLFALTLSKLFDKSVLLLIDRNYPQSFFSINTKLEIQQIDNPKQLDFIVKKIPASNNQLVIIDSITSLSTFFLQEAYFSPRAVNAFNNFTDKIIRQLASLTPHTTNLIIAHEKIKDFETGEVAPRVNKIILRNIDIVLRMFIEDGKRTIKVWQERKLPSKVEWYFGGE